MFCLASLRMDLLQVLGQVHDQIQDNFLMKTMELDLKWVHMARYGLILRQDGVRTNNSQKG